jgi:hypothetical protein
LFIDSLTFDDDVQEKSQIHNQAGDSGIYTPKIDVVISAIDRQFLNEDSVVGAVPNIDNQIVTTTPKFPKELTQPLPQLNQSALNTPIRKDGLQKEMNYTSTDFSESETLLTMPVRYTLTSMELMSWYCVRNLRQFDLELDWEKLKRAMFEGLLLNTPLNNNSNVKAKKLLLDSSWETILFGERML